MERNLPYPCGANIAPANALQIKKIGEMTSDDSADILWADLGMLTTSVQGGVRPVIVVSNNKANTYSSVITVVPLTSRIYKKRCYQHMYLSVNMI